MRLAGMVVAVFLLGAGSSHAAVELAPDPLDRGLAFAEPAVYRLQVTVDIGAIEHERGRIRLSRDAGRVTTTGTSFGVAEGGWLVAADHVSNGRGEAATIRAYQQHQREIGEPLDWEAARSWVAVNRAEARETKVSARRVTQGGRARTWAAKVVARRPGTDLALLKINAPGAPALDLSDELTRGTPVVAITYPGGDAAGDEPAARRGQLGRTGTVASTEPPGSLRTLVEAPIVRGDSGAPVVDAEGRARGMIVALSGESGGTFEPAERIRALLGQRAVAGEAAVSGLWREALSRLWALEFAQADAAFGDVLAASPDHVGAPVEQARAARLAATAGASARLDGRDVWYRRLIALALVSACGAIAAALGLIWQEAGRRPGGASEES